MLRLLEQIREGSLEAFDRFYAIAAPMVMGLSGKLLQDRMEAEDVCHDVLMTVILKPELYDASRGSVEAWLCVLTKNRCIDRLRKRKRLVLDANSGVLAERQLHRQNDTERHVMLNLQKEALHRAISELPQVHRQTIAEAYFDCRSQRELASAWQIPIGTVKSRMRYSLSRLRKAMERLGWAEAGGGRSQ